MVKTYLIMTFGCQMNEHDSEKISWVLENMGYEQSENISEADFIIFNTCAVRKSAENKVYGKLGELKDLKRKKPDLMIAVCGCMMQREDIRNTVKSKYKHVDIIFGTNNIHKLPELINSNLQTGKTVIDIDESYEMDEDVDANRKNDYKAYVNIMYGCNNFCTYCIVPYTRGRERSREPNNILLEIENLARNGCKEVTLLGQNVNSYGKTLGFEYTFVDLLKDVNDIDGIERIRFMTSHPKDISDDLINSYKTLNKLCNHLHLPVQTGSNRLLKEMNRKYSREEYLELIIKARQASPNICITTDLIIGFPGETDDDFLDTIKLVKEAKFDSAFTFLYSQREGTIASSMDNQIPEDIKHNRFNMLLDSLNPIGLEHNEKLLNTIVDILVDEVSKNDEDILSGRTEGNKLVHFKGDKNLIGDIVKVKIENVKTFTLEGILV